MGIAGRVALGEAVQLFKKAANHINSSFEVSKETSVSMNVCLGYWPWKVSPVDPRL